MAQVVRCLTLCLMTLWGLAGSLGFDHAHAAGPDPAASPPRERQAVRLSYDLSVGGFTAAEAQITVFLPPALPSTPDQSGSYRLTGTLQTSGLAATVVSFESKTESHGTLTMRDGERDGLLTLTPQAHHARNIWEDTPRQVDILYPPQPVGQPTEPQVTTRPQDEREPVTPAQMRGTLDPLSGVLALLLDRAVAPDDATFEASQTFFDGRRLYQLGLSALTPVETTGGFYSGPALRGKITYDRLGGRSKESFFSVSKGSHSAQIDLAPLGTYGLPAYVPVRVETLTHNFGGLVVLLTDVTPLPTVANP